MSELDWMDAAACEGKTDLFFDEDQYPRAKLICKGCPVRKECLNYAMAPPAERFGVFGGLDPIERHRLHRNNLRRARAS